jgi:uncharacterized protein (TIGR03437 family)
MKYNSGALGRTRCTGSVFAFILFLAALFLSAPPLFSQSQVLTCTASSVPPIVRGEGITERVGDILFICVGGTANARTTGNLSIFLNVNITNRLSAGAVTDVVLTVDNGSGPQPVTVAGTLAGPSNLVYNGLSFTLSPTGTATLRIANVRAAANQLMLLSNPTIQAFLAFNTSTLVSITHTQLPVATLVRGLYAGFSSKLVCAPRGSPLPDTLTYSNLIAAGTVFASTRVTEGFADAFGQRGVWANFNADSGERIIVRYAGFTAGARIFVPDVIAGSDAIQPTAGGDFGLPASGGQYASGGNGSLLLARVRGADANGAGGFPALIPGPGTGTLTFDSVSEVPLTSGSGSAVFEVVDANSAAQETAQFPTFLGLPPGGGAAVQTSADVSFAPVSTVMTASATDPIPRFPFISSPTDCGLIGDCNASYQPRLFVDPPMLQFTAVAGSSFQAGYLRVNNQAGGVLRWTVLVSYQSGSGWLRVDPLEGVNNAGIRVDPQPGSLAPGTYQATLTIDAGPVAGARVVPVTFVVTPAPPPPVQLPSIRSVVNAASFVTGPVAPGSLATIMGTRFNGKNLNVTFDGFPAKILFANDSQINVLVPAELGVKSTAQAIVAVDGNQSVSQQVSLAPMAPAIFPGAVLNQDYSLNSAGNPAALGSVIQIFATGLSGAGPITARLASQTITSPYYAGPAPGLLGVQQVNLIIPQDLDVPTLDVALCGNDVCSGTAKVAVQQ